jgi:AcrR family transcriptional regulator
VTRSETNGSRRGRRKGNPDTKGQILEAARRLFATHGYEGATIRSIAADAGVDPALVMHYFGTKNHLFAASLSLPANPAQVLGALLAQTRPEVLGERMITTLLEVWDTSADRNPFLAALRTATSTGPAADSVRQFIERSVVTTIAAHLPGPDSRLRAVLIGSQIAGIIFSRYVLQLEPVASADPGRLARIYGPTIQRYAFGELDAGPHS